MIDFEIVLIGYDTHTPPHLDESEESQKANEV